ncbi:MAG TPA: FecR family protein, partial [Spirochaetota bacterium]
MKIGAGKKMIRNKIQRCALIMLAMSFFAGMSIVTSCKKQNDEKPLAVAVSGIVNFVQGTVKVEKDGVSNILKVGDSVVEGIRIVTVGDKSFAEIYIGDNAIKVMGNTTLLVSRMVMSSEGKSTDLTVEKGSLFSKIPKKLEKGDDYRVRTAHAVAAVRGTEFMVSDEGIKSNIVCVDGKIAVAQIQSPDKTVVLGKNDEVDVAAGSEMVKKQIESDKLRTIEMNTSIREM